MISTLHLLKFKGSQISPRSHNWLVDFYQIHMRNMFLFAFGLSMARQLFGENIICQMNQQSIGQSLLDTRCFINGTRTDLTGSNYATLPILYHDYYQWIPVIILLMAFNFYFPFRVWSRHVHSFMEELTTSIRDQKSCDNIIRVIISSKGNNLYWKTWFLECYYALHLFVHILLLNQFFHRVLSLSGWSPSAISLLFPEMSKCFYDYFTGAGQTVGKFDCLMPLNSVYRKIFNVLYVLFFLLIPIHAMFFLYRMILALVIGIKLINMWWCLQICKQSAKTWEAHHQLDKSWKCIRGKFVTIKIDDEEMAEESII